MLLLFSRLYSLFSWTLDFCILFYFLLLVVPILQKLFKKVQASISKCDPVYSTLTIEGLQLLVLLLKSYMSFSVLILLFWKLLDFPFHHFFLQHIFIYCLLCARHCSKYWGYSIKPTCHNHLPLWELTP